MQTQEVPNLIQMRYAAQALLSGISHWERMVGGAPSIATRAAPTPAKRNTSTRVPAKRAAKAERKEPAIKEERIPKLIHLLTSKKGTTPTEASDAIFDGHKGMALGSTRDLIAQVRKSGIVQIEERDGRLYGSVPGSNGAEA